jgi:hypothetical protein
MVAAREYDFDYAVNMAKALLQEKIQSKEGSSAELMKRLSLICVDCTFAVAGEFLIHRKPQRLF